MGVAGEIKLTVSSMGAQARKVDPRGLPKIALRFTLIVFYFVLAGMVGRQIPSAVGQFDLEKDGFYYIYLALAAIWSFINIVYPLQQERPVRARFNLPVDIAFFLGAIVIAVLETRAAAIAYHWYKNQAAYHIDALFDFPPTVGNMYDIAPVKGAFGRTGKATQATINNINQGKMYTYTTTPAFASIQNLGFPIPRNSSSIDYRCPNWDTCMSRDKAYAGFQYVPKLALATGILFCILAAVLLFQVLVDGLDSLKSKKARRNNVAASS